MYIGLVTIHCKAQWGCLYCPAMNTALALLNVGSPLEVIRVYESEMAKIEREQTRMAVEMDEMERLIDAAD